MAGTDGSDVVLLVQTAPTEPGGSTGYTIVANQQNVKFDEKQTPIDVSDKSDPKNKQYIGGMGENSISLDHLYTPNDVTFAALKNALRTAATIVVERQELGDVIEWAYAIVTQISGTFEMAKAGKLATTIMVTGGWKPGAAP